MTLSIIATFFYEILVIVGGIVGYVKARSLPSLLAGLVGGGLLMVAAILQLNGNSFGLTLARIVTLILVLVFVQRLVTTRKMMPAGLMVGTGAIALVMMFSQR
jgi:uncharacterized membrane protein (UPF0136 family)